MLQIKARLADASVASSTLQRKPSEKLDIFPSIMAPANKMPIQTAQKALLSELPFNQITVSCQEADHFSCSQLTPAETRKKLRKIQVVRGKLSETTSTMLSRPTATLEFYFKVLKMFTKKLFLRHKFLK